MRIILTVLTAFTLGAPAHAEIITVNVNRVCAAIVGIPYASDNFSDEEWVQFKQCRDYLQRFNNIQ
jgi:hypothetical protein